VKPGGRSFVTTLNFAGQGALVTGAASGIGLALAHAFSAAGMRVVLCDANEAALESAMRTFDASKALAVTVDVTDRTSLRGAVERARAFAPLKIVCANAGIAPAGCPVLDTPPEKWDRIVAVNLTGVFNTLAAFVPLVRENGRGGHVVLTSSMAGMLAGAGLGDYTATKFGVTALGETLRAELAGEGIGVSVLCPGVVATPLVGEQARAAGMAPDAIARRVIEGIRNNEPYIFTHADYRPLVERRTETVVGAFGTSAEPGFQESAAVLRMMANHSNPPDAAISERRMNDLTKLYVAEEIKRLKARYFRCMDTKDWDGLATVFAEDAVFDLREVESVRDPMTGQWHPPFGGEGKIFRGRDAVLSMIRNAVQHLVTVHHGHMPEIEVIDYTRARGIWAMEDLIRNAPGQSSVKMHGFGHYHETYTRDDTGWVIHTTRITRLSLVRD
jgi:NAD(P)-dependent dehydrogenase (short-subunit alcohol dehydrogenase family)